MIYAMTYLPQNPLWINRDFVELANRNLKKLFRFGL